MHSFATTATTAQNILQQNLYSKTFNNTHYRRTVPSKEFYVHLWNWDSATHAMGLVHIDPERAFDELRSLISGQWENGLVAQITFNPQETKYFPGPQFWGTEKFARGEIITSGITQPPLLAISVAYVYQIARDKQGAKQFLLDLLPAVKKYHHYLKKYRDPEDNGLLTIIHPWESGTDNSPRWDRSLKRIPIEDIPDRVKSVVNKHRLDDKLGDTRHRPELSDYYRYMYLVDLFQSWDWDYERIVEETPFAVKDILFNALWARANEALAETLQDVGKKEEATKYAQWAKQTQDSLRTLWDSKHNIFTDLDVSSDKQTPISENTVATFTPLWAGAASNRILQSLLKKLRDPTQFWPTYPIPTTALNNPKFELTRYWRGPTWPITNLFVIEGLNRYQQYPGCSEAINKLVTKTLEMIRENGFFEYYDPTKAVARLGQKTSSSLGFGSFAWTAAIYLYLYYKYQL